MNLNIIQSLPILSHNNRIVMIEQSNINMYNSNTMKQTNHINKKNNNSNTGGGNGEGGGSKVFFSHWRAINVIVPSSSSSPIPLTCKMGDEKLNKYTPNNNVTPINTTITPNTTTTTTSIKRVWKEQLHNHKSLTKREISKVGSVKFYTYQPTSITRIEKSKHYKESSHSYGRVAKKHNTTTTTTRHYNENNKNDIDSSIQHSHQHVSPTRLPNTPLLLQHVFEEQVNNTKSISLPSLSSLSLLSLPTNLFITQQQQQQHEKHCHVLTIKELLN